MAFSFDKLRDDPRAAYVVGVVLGFALGYMMAAKPPPAFPWGRRLQVPQTRIVEVPGPCADCAEKAALAEAEGAHIES